MSAIPTPELERQQKLVDELNAQAYEERYNNTQLTLQLAQDALKKAEALHYEEGKAWALRNIGIAQAIVGNYEEAEKRFFEALSLFEQLENMRGLGLVLSNLGTIYQQMNRMDRAVEYLSRSLRYLQLVPDLAFFYGQALANLGSLFGDLEQLSLAREYHEKAIKIYEDLRAQSGMLFSLISLGGLAQMTKDYAMGEQYLAKALDIASELGEEDLVARVLLSQAQLYNEMGRHEEALDHLDRAEKLISTIQNENLQLHVWAAMMEAQLALGLLDRAQESAQRIEGLRKKVTSGVIDYFFPELQARLAEKLGNYREAYDRYKEYTQNRFKVQRAINQNLLSALDRILREDILGVQKEAAADLAVARRIQEVLLHGEPELKAIFPESVYWLQPKGIVSGDFVWVGRGKEGAQILAAVDASGAGVSAAMLSTIAHTLLYEIVTVRGVTDPGRILSQMHKSLLDLLYPTAKSSAPELETMQAEGFQVGVCTVFPSLGEVHYAGAVLPLWVYNPVLGWEQLTADKRLIGQKLETEGNAPRLYTSTIIPVEKQWVLAFLTDGWERQVRASDGKRYGRSTLREFLATNPPKNLSEWLETLRQEFERWRGGATLTDDVLLVAVRL